MSKIFLAIILILLGFVIILALKFKIEKDSGPRVAPFPGQAEIGAIHIKVDGSTDLKDLLNAPKVEEEVLQGIEVIVNDSF